MIKRKKGTGKFLTSPHKNTNKYDLVNRTDF